MATATSRLPSTTSTVVASSSKNAEVATPPDLLERIKVVLNRLMKAKSQHQTIVLATSRKTADLIHSSEGETPAHALLGVIERIAAKRISLDGFSYAAMIIKVQGQWDLTKMIFDKTPKALRSAEFYDIYIQTAFCQGKPKEAISAYQEASLSDNLSEAIILKMLIHFEKEENYTEAKKVYEKVVNKKLLTPKIDAFFMNVVSSLITNASERDDFPAAKIIWDEVGKHVANQVARFTFFKCVATVQNPDVAYEVYQTLSEDLKAKPAVINVILELKGKNGAYFFAKAFYQNAVVKGSFDEATFATMMELAFNNDDFPYATRVLADSQKTGKLPSEIYDHSATDEYSFAKHFYQIAVQAETADPRLFAILLELAFKNEDSPFVEAVFVDFQKTGKTPSEIYKHGINRDFAFAKNFYQTGVADTGLFTMVMELALTCRDFAFLEKVYTDSQIAEKTNLETYVQVLSAIKMGARIESAADPETGLDNAKRIFAKAKAEEKATVELYNLMIQIAGIYGEIEYAKELFEETKQTATCETYEAILFSAGINQDRNYANHTFLAGQRAYGKLVPAMIHTCSIIGALDAAERKFLQSLHQKSIARGREMSLEHVKEQYKTKDTPPTLLIPETIEAWDYAKRIYSSLDKKTQSGDKFIPVETCVSFILFGGEIADFSFAKQVFEKARSVKLAAPELFSALIETATRCKTPEATSYAKDVFAQAKGENVHALVYDKMIDLAAADGDVRLVRELVAEAKGRGFLTRNVCDAYISCLVQHDLLTEALKAFEEMNFSFSRENRGTPFEIVIQTEKTGTPSIDLNGFSIGMAIVATLKFFEKQKSENQPTDKLIIKLGDIRGISNLQSHLDPRYPVRTVFMDLFHALFDPVEGNPNKIAYPNLRATHLPGYARNVSKILFKNTEITKTKTT